MLESIDDGMGMIMETLERMKLDDNTIIIFTSDNGGETNVTSNVPLREDPEPSPSRKSSPKHRS